MDTQAPEYFADVIALARTVLSDVDFIIDTTPARAILRLQGQYGVYRVFIVELCSSTCRKYRYYVLKDTWVEAGFDNSPDPRALQLKYGPKASKTHSNELVPHLHRADKTGLYLTEAVDFKYFTVWLTENLQKTSAA